MSIEVRVFIAHGRECTDEEIAEWQVKVTQAVLAANGALDPKVTSARDSYLAFEKRYGAPVNWNLWIQHVVGAQGFDSPEPRYHIFVVPKVPFGRATNQLLREASKKGRRLRYLSPASGRLEKVKSILTIDASSWKDGWALVTE